MNLRTGPIGDAQVETDYLIVGAGAMGMAFADVIFSEQPDAEMVIVDRRHRAGGHWTDAYPYVALHQPAAFYGVNSMQLGQGGTDLASGWCKAAPISRRARRSSPTTTCS